MKDVGECRCKSQRHRAIRYTPPTAKSAVVRGAAPIAFAKCR